MTEKQRRFCEEYLVDLNGRQAAIRAGYSPGAADSMAHEFLHDPKHSGIQERIARAEAERSRRTGITADRVLLELARVGFSQPEMLIDFETAQVRDDASEDDLRCIAGCKVKYIPRKEYDAEADDWVTVTAVEREVKLYDKLKALDMLAKHLGMYDQQKQSDEKSTGVVLLPVVAAIAEDKADGE